MRRPLLLPHPIITLIGYGPRRRGIDGRTRARDESDGGGREVATDKEATDVEATVQTHIGK